MADSHDDAASASQNKDELEPKGTEVEVIEDESDKDPYTTALEKLTKKTGKAKQVAEKALSGVDALASKLDSFMERFGQADGVRTPPRQTVADEDEEIVTDDGSRFKKREVEDLKKLARAAGFQQDPADKKLTERMSRFFEDTEINEKLDEEGVSPPEKKLIKELLKTRIKRTDDLDDDIRIARAFATSMVREQMDDEEYAESVRAASASSGSPAGQKTKSRVRLSAEQREYAKALKALYPDKKTDWEGEIAKHSR